MLRKRTPLAVRLWARISKAGPTDCWLWTGTIRKNGYGCIGIGGYKGGNMLAHRAVFEDANGPITPGLIVMHLCDTPLCCNPAHLHLGTHADNIADMIAKGRDFRGDQRGEKNGFSKLTPANVRAIRTASGTLAEIGKHYGIGTSTVHDIRTRRSWAHIE